MADCGGGGVFPPGSSGGGGGRVDLILPVTIRVDSDGVGINVKYVNIAVDSDGVAITPDVVYTEVKNFR